MAIRQLTWGLLDIWSDGTEDDLFHPMSPVMETGRIKEVRATLDMCQSTGNLTASVAYTLSNDGLTWGTPVTIEVSMTPICTVTTNEVQYSSGFTDVSAALHAKRFVRFGVNVRNTDDQITTARELARIALQLDTRDC